MEEQTDAAGTRASLLARLAQSPADQGAWTQFVARYGPQIGSWCRHWGLQEADAQDISQAVLALLASKLQAFVYDPRRRFRSWLKLLTRHAWSDLIAARLQQVAGSGDSGILDALHTAEARDDLVTRLQDAFDLELLEGAMARVQGRVAGHTWEAFRLTALEGLSGAEAGARLGMAVGLVFKARSNVQKLLKEAISQMERIETP